METPVLSKMISTITPTNICHMFQTSYQVKNILMHTKTKTATSAWQIYRRTHQEILPSFNSILKWAQNFREHQTVEILSQPGRASMTSEDERKISNFFSKYPKTPLKIAENSLSLSKSSIQRVFRNRLYLFRYRLHIVEEFENMIVKLALSFLLGASKISIWKHRFLIVIFLLLNVSFMWMDT